jgi:type IV pilus assembly protein PilV
MDTMRAEPPLHLHPTARRGFSLIEVLVALFVLSLGLLGLAALQTTGLKFNHRSYERTQAVLQAYDIIDRMRANKGNGGAINSNYDGVALGATPGTADCASGCTADQLAQYDIRKWNETNAALLAEGKGAICRGTFAADLGSCNVGGNIYRIALKWKESDIYVQLNVEAQP